MNLHKTHFWLQRDLNIQEDKCSSNWASWKENNAINPQKNKLQPKKSIENIKQSMKQTYHVNLVLLDSLVCIQQQFPYVRRSALVLHASSSVVPF